MHDPAAPLPVAGPPAADAPASPFSRRQRLAGWAVHLYTASGSVLGLLTVLAAIEGEIEFALWLVLVTLLVDGTDGMLARRVRVKESIPWFDGALLDNIVDYLTFTFVAVVLLWTDDRLPDGGVGWVVAALPLLASCYQFCRVDAKTEDHYFLGFPSYWNIVALYAIVLDFGTTAVAVTLVVLTVLVFVPIKYVYPSRTPLLLGLNMALATVWLVSVAVLVLQYPDPHPVAVALSLAYPVYYTVISVWLTVSDSRRRVGSPQGGQTAP
jgi:phosphatidylcholine synthase